MLIIKYYHSLQIKTCCSGCICRRTGGHHFSPINSTSSEESGSFGKPKRESVFARVKELIPIMKVFFPLTLYWAISYQRYSSFVLQGVQTDCRLGRIEIPPGMYHNITLWPNNFISGQKLGQAPGCMPLHYRNGRIIFANVLCNRYKGYRIKQLTHASRWQIFVLVKLSNAISIFISHDNHDPCRHDAQYWGFSYAPDHSIFGIHCLPTSPEKYENKDTANTQGIQRLMIKSTIHIYFTHWTKLYA